jgi:hypothetical protein
MIWEVLSSLVCQKLPILFQIFILLYKHFVGVNWWFLS